MAASSVSGVGIGSASGGKGSEHSSLGVSRLVGTRTVVANSITLAGGVATVTFPVPLTGSKANYVVMCSGFNSTTVARATSTTNNAAGNFSSFAIAGGTTDVVNYIVVKVGFDG